MSREKIIEKIRNLFKRTADNGASEAEVETAMKIAHKMMETHAIEMADLLDKQSKTLGIDDIEQQCVRTHCKIDRWEKRMAMCVCMMTDTKCYFSQSHVIEKGKIVKKHHVTYYGQSDDVAAAFAMYVELLIVFKTMARHRLGKKWTQAHYHYMEGFGTGMLSIFHEQKSQMQRERSSGTTGMILHKSALIRQFEETKLNLRTRVARPTRKREGMRDAYGAGYTDGRAYEANPDRSKKLD
jgi:hypothetical protein